MEGVKLLFSGYWLSGKDAPAFNIKRWHNGKERLIPVGDDIAKK